MDLKKTRFYGAKSEEILNQKVVAEIPANDYAWQILEVDHGKIDHYQVLISDDEDILDTDEGAQTYLEHLPNFGEISGDMSGKTAHPLRADQSNTSLIVDEKWILKVFRKLEIGLNPDVELLSEISDCPYVAGVRGHLTRDGQTLAMMQQFITDGRDGFQLALDPGLESEQELGTAIRTVHEALSDAFGTESVSGSQIRDSLNAHLDEILTQTDALNPFEDNLREIYSRVPDDHVDIQRIHGDLHLGQTLLSDRWYLIDFEGEPARPLEQRRLPDHPLRDVAGMVRSFGYVHAMGGQADVDKLLAGYEIEPNPILDAYIADKAAYEVVYESNNRPDWVEIPLRAIRELS